MQLTDILLAVAALSFVGTCIMLPILLTRTNALLQNQKVIHKEIQDKISTLLKNQKFIYKEVKNATNDKKGIN